jgi:hypothetical protein
MLSAGAVPVTASRSLWEDALVAREAETTHLGPLALEYDLVASAISCPIAEELRAIDLKVSRAKQGDRGDTKLVTHPDDNVLRSGLGGWRRVSRCSSA